MSGGRRGIPYEAYDNARDLDKNYDWPANEASRLTPWLPPEKEDPLEFRCTGYDQEQVQDVSAKQLWADNPFFRNSPVGKILAGTEMNADTVPSGSGADRDLGYHKAIFDQTVLMERKRLNEISGQREERAERDRLRSMAKEAKGAGYRITYPTSAKKRRINQELMGHYEEVSHYAKSESPEKEEGEW